MKKQISLLLALVLCLSCVFSACSNKSTAAQTVNVKSVADLAGLKIGTQADSAALEAMQANEAWDTFKDNVKEYGTYDEAILELKAGRIDVIAVDEVLGEYKNSKMDNALSLCDFDFSDDFYAIGCRNGETDVAAKLTDAIQQLKNSGKAAEISDKWFGKDIVICEDYAEKLNSTPPVSGGWEYIQNKGTLVVGLDDTFAPMGFRDESNNLVGFDIDLANAVGELLGIQIVFQPISWDAKELELSSKKIDCIWNGMSATEERQQNMALTYKYLNNKIVLMSLVK